MLRAVTLLPERRTLQLELWEAAPDVMVGDKPGNVRPPRHGVVFWEPVGDGHNWRPRIETHPALVPLKQWDTKLYGCPRLVIQALVEGGFVEGERISPRCLNINLESWMQHRAMVRSNPWFWRDMDNLRRYTTALHAVNSQGKRGKLKSVPKLQKR